LNIKLITLKNLYIQENKKNGKHFDMKTANDIWQGEYSSMINYFKKIRDQEKANKNEFDDEKAKNLELRRGELLDFINKQDFNIPEFAQVETSISNIPNVIPSNDVSDIVESIENSPDILIKLILIHTLKKL